MKVLLSGPVPRRKGKPKPNVLEKHQDYVTLKNLILSGKMAPYISRSVCSSAPRIFAISA